MFEKLPFQSAESGKRRNVKLSKRRNVFFTVKHESVGRSQWPFWRLSMQQISRREILFFESKLWIALNDVCTEQEQPNVEFAG